jgi:hypothetical protein
VLVAEFHVHGITTRLFWICAGCVRIGHHDNSITSKRGFGDQKDHTEQQHTKEDGADPEGPLITVVLDDVPGNQRTSGDSSQQEKIPDGDAGGAFMDKIEITDGTLDEYL